MTGLTVDIGVEEIEAVDLLLTQICVLVFFRNLLFLVVI